MRQNRSKHLISARASERSETKSFQLLEVKFWGLRPPDPLTRGSAPGPAGGTALDPDISPKASSFPPN